MLLTSVANVGEVEPADPPASDPVRLTPLRKEQEVGTGLRRTPGIVVDRAIRDADVDDASADRADLSAPRLGDRQVRVLLERGQETRTRWPGRAYAVWVSGDRRPHRIHVFPEDDSRLRVVLRLRPELAGAVFA